MIENVVIMALDKRLDMAEELKRQCESLGFEPQLFISGDGTNESVNYNNIDPDIISCQEFRQWQWGSGESAWRHCCAFLTHQKIVKKALKGGYNNLLILEDDAVFLDRYSDVMNQIWPQIPPYWDIIYLGWHSFEYENHRFAGMNLRIEEKYKQDGIAALAPIRQCGGLFGALINRSLFQRILNMPPNSPVDNQLNYMRDSIISLNIIPMSIYVKSCESNCEGYFIKRDNLNENN